MTGTPTLAVSYADARARALHAAAAAGASVVTHPHHLTGPNDSELAIDVATSGDPSAPHALVVVSGTHGVEGYCGSALQTRLLEQVAAGLVVVPDGLALHVVHALNPFGMAWVRRVNEDNIDLNRNAVNWADPPHNDAYDDLADLLVPGAWDAETQSTTTNALLAQAATLGFEALQQAITGGQYRHPHGVFYGGSGPSWSHRWLAEWVPHALGHCSRVAVLDLHTGLGPSGHGELISSDRVTDERHRRAVEWWGDVKSALDGMSVSAPISGDWLASLPDLLPAAELTAVAIEYGTVDPVTVLQSLRADAWLYAHGDPTGPDGDRVRRQVWEAFLDDRPEWMDAVAARFDDVFGAALARLSPA